MCSLQNTVIGRSLNSSRKRMALAAAIGILIVAADYACFGRSAYPDKLQEKGRGLVAVLALAGSLWLVNGDLASVGFRFTPLQGWRYWVPVSLAFGAAVVVCFVVGITAFYLSRRQVPDGYWPDYPVRLYGIVSAAIHDEIIIALALCSPLVVVLGPWKAIVASGFAFAGMHFIYGEVNPMDLLGGFFLAWAYVKSESIVVTLLLHGLGSLCVCAGGWVSFVLFLHYL